MIVWNSLWILPNLKRHVRTSAYLFKSVSKSINLKALIYIYRKKEEFVEKGVDQDVIELRYKHFRTRQIDTINRVLEERRTISKLFKNDCLEMRE